MMRNLGVRALLAAAGLALAIAAASCGGSGDDAATPAALASPRAASPSATLPAAAPTVAEATPTAAPADVPTAAQPTRPPASTAAPPAPAPTATPVPPEPIGVSITVAAVGLKFLPNVLSAPPGSTVTVTLDNQDAGVLHDIIFFGPDGSSTGRTELITGPAQASTAFVVAASGRYTFKCSVHPLQMSGALNVQ